MSNKTVGDPRSTTDQILDLLLDALAERQKARQIQVPAGTAPSLQPPQPEATRRGEQGTSELKEDRAEPSSTAAIPPPRPEPPQAEQRRAEASPRPAKQAPSPRMPAEPKPGQEDWEPPPRQPSINLGKMLGRLAILVAVLLVLVNIPVTRYGVSLARIMPETGSLIIRDGLVLKGSGPEIYILQDDKLRWISSLDAFEHLGLSWKDVHIVDDKFLDTFEKGRPIHVLLKCQASPHIYRLENDQKRWIKDIDTFTAEGHVWEDVRFVSCQYLRDLPDGPPIPEDAGPPPEP